jgi:hypothetical protein
LLSLAGVKSKKVKEHKGESNKGSRSTVKHKRARSV